MKFTQENIMEVVRGFQPAAVVIAAAELDLFTILHANPMEAAQLARKIKGELRATVILLDALVALELLTKSAAPDPIYRVTRDVAKTLTETGSDSMLGMVRHLGNCYRNWGDLAHIVKRGVPAGRQPSVRGAEGDLASFIQAMHEVSVPMAMPLIEDLGALDFSHLLDLGGASGTWTIPFLQLNPEASATIFDQPGVIPMAEQLMEEAGLAERVRLVAGNFYTDPLPTGADLVWVSAIVHQNSREQNRAMFAKVFEALEAGGKILIRDIVMDSSRTKPVSGALFAVNMLTATQAGGTFTFNELQEDLSCVGFQNSRLLHCGQWMDSILCASKL